MTHLTAVSGANVTIVCGAVLFSARLIGPRVAVRWPVALVSFVIVVQPTASVLRAAVMGAIALAGMLSSRRRQAIPALSATVLVLMVVAPHLAVDVGFALSVVATAALVVIAPVWSRRLVGSRLPQAVGGRRLRRVGRAVVTAPLVAGISGRVSLIGAVANLAVAAADSADHRAGQRGGRVVLALADRCAAVDPVHRARTVVGVAGGALGGRCARRDGAGSVRDVPACWWSVLPRCCVVLWRWRWFRGRDGGAAAAGCLGLVAVGTTRRPHVTPSWGEPAGFGIAPGPGRRGTAGRAGRGGGAAVGAAAGRHRRCSGEPDAGRRRQHLRAGRIAEPVTVRRRAGRRAGGRRRSGQGRRAR